MSFLKKLFGGFSEDPDVKKDIAQHQSVKAYEASNKNKEDYKPVYVQRSSNEEWKLKDDQKREMQSKRQRDLEALFEIRYNEIYREYQRSYPRSQPSGALELRVWNDIRLERIQQNTEKRVNEFDYDAYDKQRWEVSIDNPKNKQKGNKNNNFGKNNDFGSGNVFGDGNQTVNGDVHIHNHYYNTDEPKKSKNWWE